MPRKSTRGASGSSPEKTPAPTRRATRRGQKVSETENSSEVADEIPLHLLRGSDESSEHSDNDSDYGSPKKGRGGGRAPRGRGRRAKEVKEVEEKPTPTRTRRGRRAAVRDKTPETISEEPEQLSQEPPESINSQTDEHETSTMESEHTKSPQHIEPEETTQEQQQQAIVAEDEQPESIQVDKEEAEEEKQRSPTPEPPQEIQEEPIAAAAVVVAEKVSEVEQELQSNNDQANNEVESTDDVKNVDEESIQSGRDEEDNNDGNVKSVEHVVEEIDTTNDDAPELPQEKSSSDRSRSNSSEHEKVEKPEERKIRSRSSSGEIHDDSCDHKMEVDEPIQKASPVKSPQKVETKAEEPKVSGHQRKRKWGARKFDTEPVIAITTDSLKNIISEEVKPVPLSDVKLVMSPSPDREPNEKRPRTKPTAEDKDAKKQQLKERLRKQEEEEERRNEQIAKVLEKRQASPTITIVANGAGKERKVSLVHEENVQNAQAAAPPTPPKNQTSRVLCITNLVRPLTVLSLKALLARTGKIADFWIDPIKSKCIVKFETEDEAVETRHALHGVKWPDHNLKTLNVEFSTEEEMAKASLSTIADRPTGAAADSREAKTDKGFGWSKADVAPTPEDRSKTSRRVREWDVGKKEDTDRSRDDNRRRRRSSERENRREKERKVDETVEKRRSASASPGPEAKGEDTVVVAQPGRLLDDLFRKTKAVPCIYWLPLAEEQVKEKEEQRQKNLEENKRRLDEMLRVRREAREQRMREREKERDRKRSRSNSRGRNRNRRSTSRDRNRNRFDRR